VATAHAEVLRAREAAEAIQQGQVEGEVPAVDPVEVQRQQRSVATAEKRVRTVEAACTRSTIQASSAVQRGEQAEATRRRAEAKLATCREQIGLARQTSGPSPRIRELELHIGDAADELVDGSVADLQGRLGQATAEVDRLQAEADQAALYEGVARVAADRVETGKRKAWSEAEEWRRLTPREVAHRCESERAELIHAERRAEPARDVLRTVQRLLAEAAKQLEDSATCPTCGGMVDASRLQALDAAQAQAVAPVLVASAAHDAAEKRARAEVAARQGELDAAHDDAHAATVQAQTDLAPLAQRTLALLHDRQEAQRLVRSTDAQLSRAQAEVATMREELASARASSAGSEQATLAERERALQAEVAGIHVPALAGLRKVLEQSEDLARRQRQQAADEMATARSDLQPLEQALTLQREVMRLRGEVTRWETAWREAQRVEGELGPAGMMGAVLDEATEPLEALVNAGLGDLGLGIFGIRRQDDRGTAVFRPGLLQGEAFVPVETLTGGQRASVVPVFVSAVADLIGSGLRLVMDDETEKVSHDRLGAYLGGMAGLVQSGRVDQVLIAGCPHLPPQVEGVHVIQVGR